MTIFRRLTGPLKVLVLSQFAFNVGFYLVVPFLAAYLEDDLLLGGAMVGFVLGVRTFSQQGLFFVGGALADRFGITPVVLAGGATRVAGFLTLAFAQSLPLVLLAVVLIGFAAALFSPASESAIAGLAGTLERDGGPRRTETLSVQAVASQAGSAVGPVLGGLVAFVPFSVMCLIAAGVFVVIGIAHVIWLPRGLRVGAPSSTRRALTAALRNRDFVTFAALNGGLLLAYNQMYLALPVELARSGDDPASITWYFLLASACVILGQTAVTRLVDRLSVRRVFQLGYAVTALGFATIAAVAWFPSPPGLLGAAPKIAFVVLLHLGAMIVGPRSRDAVAVLAREQHLGAHMGIVASAGGLIVLLGSVPIGALLESAQEPHATAATAWLALTALMLLCAAAAGPLLSRIANRAGAAWAGRTR
ncbi:MFS transporter [Microbacterium sp.]|uniref:MFS transporter n=1 Tax=Microbacterium sp. TaxID=51671 RepID=UPI003A86865B